MSAREGCPVTMMRAWICGRPIHDAPPGIDSEPVCLMHSRDPNKDATAFQAELQRITDEAADLADFAAFVFPDDIKLYNLTFRVDAFFRHAVFPTTPYFLRCIFQGAADFQFAEFASGANFEGAAFRSVADFSHTRWNKQREVVQARFDEVTFDDRADFSGATFECYVDFREAIFAREAVFAATAFRGHVRFLKTKFLGPVQFRETEFRGDPGDLKRESDHIMDNVFGDLVPSEEKAPEPRKYSHDEAISAGASFSKSYFADPKQVSFYRTYMGQVLLNGSAIAACEFSQVRWARRDGSGKAMLFDEVASLDEPDIFGVMALRPDRNELNPRNYRLIGELYRELKRKYDDQSDYATAGDFHYGEMEMKRLYSPARSRVAHWLHRSLGLVAWYKYASAYGESYLRPAVWLMIVLALFTLLYPIAGLRCADCTKGPAAPTDVLQLAGDGFMTALYIAAFQKGLTYEPSYPWGRVLALIEVLLTSSLIALFLLAVRRQFRR